MRLIALLLVQSLSLLLAVDGVLLPPFKESYPDSYNPTGRWATVQGGNALTPGCGVVVAGKAMTFTGSTRFMQTEDIDTRDAAVVQYHIRMGGGAGTGCGTLRSGDNVLVQYSVDAGVAWITLTTHTTTSNVALFVSTSLPDTAQKAAVRFRWTQPTITNADSPWSIDNIYIGGPSASTVEFADTFAASSLNEPYWLFADNGQVSTWCGRDAVLFSGTSGRREITTTNLNVSSVLRAPLPLLYEDFNTSPLASSTWFTSLGGFVTALAGTRSLAYRLSTTLGDQGHITTRDLDLRLAHSITAIYFVGGVVASNAPLGVSGNGISIQYSTNGGSAWSTFGYVDLTLGYQPISHTLPLAARTQQTSLRWIQLDNTETHAYIDELRIFGQPETLAQRTALTPSYTIQFELFMGDSCTNSAAINNDNDIYLEYSTDRGASFSNVVVDTPTFDAVNNYSLGYQAKSRFVFSEYGSAWRRIAYQLNAPLFPLEQVSFRIRQDFTVSNPLSSVNKFALAHFYFGPNCPNGCAGHGRCLTAAEGGGCLCDSGYSYVVADNACVPATNNTSLVGAFSDDFDTNQPRTDVWDSLAGAARTTVAICNTMAAGNTLFFGASSDPVRHATTRDLDTTDAVFLQFLLQYGGGACGAPNIAYRPVFSYSTNGGASWHLISDFPYTLFLVSRHVSFLIDDRLRHASIRFRWEMPFFGSATADRFQIDNVVLGGSLAAGPLSEIIEDFAVSSSVTNAYWTSRPNSVLKSDVCGAGPALAFGGLQGLRQLVSVPLELHSHITTRFFDTFTTTNLDATKWQTPIGGAPSNGGGGCGPMQGSNFLYFNQAGTRLASTQPIDTRDMPTIGFYISIGGGINCHLADAATEGVTLSYSVDGGTSFHPIAIYTSSSHRGPVFVSESLAGRTPPAQASAVEFRWSQQSNSGLNFDEWGLDSVVVERVNLRSENMSTLEVSLQLGQCVPSGLGDSDALELSYSVNQGITWEPLYEKCLPGTERCLTNIVHNTLYPPARLSSRTRFFIPIPEAAVASNALAAAGTRIRIAQPDASALTTANEWSVARVVLTNKCPGYCNGHGSCATGVCVCDSGFVNDPLLSCVPSVPSVSTLRDTFEWTTTPPADVWSRIVGAVATGVDCGTTAASDGTRLIFSASTARSAETVDMRIREGDVLQVAFFTQSSGSGSYCSSVSSSQPVTLSYSTDGGTTWTYVATLGDGSASVQVSESYVYALPEGAWTNATRLRIEQVLISSPNADDWAIDDFFVGGAEVVASLDDQFDTIDESNFLFHPNGAVGTFCARQQVLHFSGLGLTRAVTTRSIDTRSEQYDLYYDSFDSGSLASWWDTASGVILSTDLCFKELSSSHSAVFTSTGGATRSLMTKPLNASDFEAVVFWLQAGHSGGTGSTACNAPYSGANMVLEYLAAGLDANQASLWSTLLEVDPGATLDTSDPIRVGAVQRVMNLPAAARTMGVRFRWRQTTFVDSRNFWSLDSVLFVRAKPTQQVATFVQFSLNIGCGVNVAYDRDVFLEYSTDRGVTWKSPVHMACLSSFGFDSVLCSLDAPPIARFTSEAHRPAYTRVTFPIVDTAAASPHTQFRLRQAGTWGSTTREWAIDDLYVGHECPDYCGGHGMCRVGGTCLCDTGYSASGSTCVPNTPLATEIFDRIDTIRADTWASIVAGELIQASDNSGQCGLVSEGTYLLFTTDATSQRGATTVDLDMRDGHFIQVNIVLGSKCGGSQDAGSNVYLMYSTDSGVHWTHMFTYTPSSPWSTGATSVVEIPSRARTARTRFRWIQLRTDSQSSSTRRAFGLDDLFIGGNSTHGYPSSRSVSVAPVTASEVLFTPLMTDSAAYCTRTNVLASAVTTLDDAYVRREVQLRPVATNSSVGLLFYESVESTSTPSQFVEAMGGSVTCGAKAGYALFATGSSRTVLTPVLSGSLAERVTFWIKLGGPDDAAAGFTNCKLVDAQEDVVLQYTVDGGASYHLLGQYAPESPYTDPRGTDLSVVLPVEARVDTLQLRWTQPITTSGTNDQWALDEIAVHAAPLERSSVVNVEIQMGCGTTLNENKVVELQYSVDLGTTWQNLWSSCQSCAQFRTTTSFHSSNFLNTDYRRMSTFVPLQARGPSTRFRLVDATQPFSAAQWALASISVDSSCGTLCSGHGVCVAGACVCDSGYTRSTSGVACVADAGTLLPYFRDMLDASELDGNNFVTVVGGSVQKNPCRVQTHGTFSLFFDLENVQQRYADTPDIDVTRAAGGPTFVEFASIMRGESNLCSGYVVPAETIALFASVDGGSSWQIIDEIDGTSHHYYMLLPSWTRSGETVRFRWLQYSYSSNDQWALDNVYAGGSAVNPAVLADTFDPVDETNWMFHGLIDSAPRCNTSSALAHFALVDDALADVTGPRRLQTRELNTTLYSLRASILGFGDDFDSYSSSTTLPTSLWDSLSIGYNSQTLCGVASKALTMTKAGTRQAVTAPMNTFGALSLDFTLYFPTGTDGCDPLEAGDGVIVSYSHDAGSTWTTLASYDVERSGSFAVVLLLDTPVHHQTTQFRWLQKTLGGNAVDKDVWSLDSVELVTNGQASGPFLQFEYYPLCGDGASILMDVEVQYSVDDGATYAPLTTMCSDYGSVTCPMRFASSQFASIDDRTDPNAQGGYLVQLPIFLPVQLSERLRIRWYQDLTGPSGQDFGIDNVLVGEFANCPDMCSGHGRCDIAAHTCVCDRGYSGAACSLTETRPSYLEDDLSAAQLDPQHFTRVRNEVFKDTSSCDVNEPALKFNGEGARYLETVDLDMRNGSEVVFWLSFASSSCTGVSAATDSLYFEYSILGGVIWHELLTWSARADYQEYRLILPDVARAPSVRFRWHQPTPTSNTRGRWVINRVNITAIVPLEKCGDGYCREEHNENCTSCALDCFCGEDICASLPCQNNGNCTSSHLTDSFTCLCAPGFTGELCESAIDVCASSPCTAGGTCMPTVYPAFVCACPSGTTGDLCEVDTTQCVNPGTVVNTMAQLNAFAGCVVLRGPPLVIDGAGLTAISSLGALSSLASVHGLDIRNNANGLFSSMSGLDALEEVVGDFLIESNSGLLSLGGLGSLRNVTGSFVIDGNLELVLTTGLGALESVGGDLRVENNLKLQSLEGPASLSHVGGNLVIGSNGNVEIFFQGFSQLSRVDGYVWVVDNQKLAHVDGLVGLVTVGTGLLITGNPLLSSIGGLAHVRSNGGYIAVTNNAGFVAICDQLGARLLAATAGTKTGTGTVEGRTGTVEFGVYWVLETDPCMFGMPCLERPASNFGCECSELYTGERCETIFVPCTSDPCQNGGTCTNATTSAYECTCPQFYGGVNCEDCEEGRYGNSCLAQCTPSCQTGTCNDGLAGDGVCGGCPSDRYGPQCLSCNCLNGGTCADGASGDGSCTCAVGWGGQFCHVELDVCESSPCHNGGTCTKVAVGVFTCTCTGTGYNGTLCDEDINECSAGHAGAVECATQTGNVCVNVNGTFECHCEATSYGALATAAAATCTPCGCDTSAGATGTSCSSSGQCTCAPGWESLACDSLISGYCGVFGGAPVSSTLDTSGCGTQRLGDQCSYTCVAGYTLSTAGLRTNVTCLASALWSTESLKVCLKVCPEVPAPSNGTPVCPATSIENVQCVQACDAGFAPSAGNLTRACMGGEWTGSALTCADIDECASSPCANGGTCANGLDAYACTCPEAYTGVSCEEGLECASSPCRNGGTCTELTGDYQCNCTDTGFQGKSCGDIASVGCDSSPCRNGGVCSHDALLEWSCDCALTGFTGVVCEVATDECASSPCVNGATCVDIHLGYTCTCTAGYTDAVCSTSIDECASSPCVNGATCVDIHLGHTCTCTAGYTDAVCSTNMDECASSPCANGGVCADGVASFLCDCALTGFDGATCVSPIDECASSPCANGGVCADGVASFLCDCALTGFDGATCASPIDECASMPCLNAGVCQDGLAAYTCNCAFPYTGTLCETRLDDLCARGTIDASGGVLTSSSAACGSFQLEFAVGAVASAIVFTAYAIPANSTSVAAFPDSYQLATTQYFRIEPSGTVFGGAGVTVTIDIDAGAVVQSKWATIRVHASSSGADFEEVEATVVNETAQVVRGTLRHLSVIAGAYDAGVVGAASSSNVGLYAGAAIGIILLALIVIFVVVRRNHRGGSKRARLSSSRSEDNDMMRSSMDMTVNPMVFGRQSSKLPLMDSRASISRDPAAAEYDENGELLEDLKRRSSKALPAPDLPPERRFQRRRRGESRKGAGRFVVPQLNDGEYAHGYHFVDDLEDNTRAEDDEYLNVGEGDELQLYDNGIVQRSLGVFQFPTTGETVDAEGGGDDDVYGNRVLKLEGGFVGETADASEGQVYGNAVRDTELPYDDDHTYGNTDTDQVYDTNPMERIMGNKQEPQMRAAASLPPRALNGDEYVEPGSAPAVSRAASARLPPPPSRPVPAAGPRSVALPKRVPSLPQKSQVRRKSTKSREKERATHHDVFKEMPQATLGTSIDGFYADDDAEEVNALLLDHQFVRSWLEFDSEIGKGQFGYVIRASTTRGKSDRPREFVAVKTLNPSASQRDMDDFIAEAQLLSELAGCPHVLDLMGVCMDRPPWLIVTSCAQHGDLRTFMRRVHSLQGQMVIAYNEFLQICSQVAQGMHFLGSRGVIHRDLAARNCLIYTGNLVKVSDFGLAIMLNEGESRYVMPKGGKLPIRWMAPEVLIEGVYEVQSDVWSYGVLVWEVLTLGSLRPYGDVPTSGLVRFIEDGGRLPQPAACPEALFSVLRDVWSRKPENRPRFSEIRMRLEEELRMDAVNSKRHVVRERDLGKVLDEWERRLFGEEDEEDDAPALADEEFL